MAERVATLEERVSSNGKNIGRMMPWGEALVELRGMFQGLREDVHHLTTDIGEIRKTIADGEHARQEREQAHRTERKADRRVMWTLVAAVSGAVITGFAGIVAALVGAG